ncbi:MAG: amidase [Actinobacteria bacterium]|nr:amidase [Actinomycetota bacterium]
MTVRPPVDELGAFVVGPRRLAVGALGGPLAGVRVAVKDVFDVAGTVTGAGNPTFARDRAPADHHAAAVEGLLAAGATVIGRTVTDELAYSLAGRNPFHGAPRNPAAPGHLTGGSSSGSAAAVAGGASDLGLGTDTGGSIRLPASWCGLWGWRPTHGAVDTAGLVPLAPSFDTVGLLAADPELLRRGAEVLLDASTDDDRPLQLRWWDDALDAVDDPLRRALADAVERAAVGRPDHVRLGLDPSDAAAIFRVLQGREAWATHGPWIDAVGPELGPDVAERFRVASRLTADDEAAARPVRETWRDALVAAADGTVLLQPAAPGPAPPVDVAEDELDAVRGRVLALTSPAGLAGLPVVVVPAGTVDGRPVGLALVGAPGTDRRLLRLAARFR